MDQLKFKEEISVENECGGKRKYFKLFQTIGKVDLFVKVIITKFKYQKSGQ